MTRDQAEEYTQALGQVVAGGWRQIALGESLGVPKALGLTTPQWVEQRLGGYVKLSVAESKTAIRELKQQGKSTRDIEALTGISKSTVSRTVPNGTARTANTTKSVPNRTSPLETITALAATNEIRDAAARHENRSTREQQASQILHSTPTTTVAGIHHGDFRSLAPITLESESIHLVLTDPPYDEESVAIYEAAAHEASRILRPGGSLLMYSGHKHLHAAIAAAAKHMRYWWTFALVHDGPSALMKRLGIRCGWKPIIWFVKETRGDVTAIISDVIAGGGREKDAHEWQQAEAEAAALIEAFTKPGEYVVDFCAGSGTVLAAAKKLDRRFAGFETRADYVEKIAQRVA